MAIEKIKILGAILELPAKQHNQFNPFKAIIGQMAELAVLFSWLLQSSPQDLDSFNGNGCRLFIWAYSNETYAPQFIGLNKFFLGSVVCMYYY